jgi:hypothetical protein
MFLNETGTAWIMMISRGTSLTAGSVSGLPVTNADKVLIADYDGDGRADFIRPDGNFYRIHRSDGSGLPASYTDSISSTGADSAVAFLADISGSGYPEIVRTSGSTWWRHVHKSDLADVVTDFSDGLGRTISVEYASLAQSDAYTLDLQHAPSEPTVRRYAGPRYVVTTETHDDGLGGTRDAVYETDHPSADFDGDVLV